MNEWSGQYKKSGRLKTYRSTRCVLKWHAGWTIDQSVSSQPWLSIKGIQTCIDWFVCFVSRGILQRKLFQRTSRWRFIKNKIKMTIALIVPNVAQLDEFGFRRMIEAVKKSRWIYTINFAFVWSTNEMAKFFNHWMDQVFKEYEEEDFTFECFGVEKFWTEDKVKEVMQKLDNDYYCVMDPNIVMFETFFQRLIDGFNDEWHDVWMVCPRFTIGEKAFDGGVYFEPWRKCFMIEKRNLDEFLNKSFFNYTNDNVSKILRNCVCHRYGTDKLTLWKDDLSCDLYI